MRVKRAKFRPRAGLTMLELIIASSMLAVLLTAISVVLRTSRAAWDAQEDDIGRLEAAHATLRHVVREVRQAQGVVAMSTVGDTSGSLSLTGASGATLVWDHDSNTQRMNFGEGAANQLLAPQIAGFRVEGYRADGATLASTPEQVQLLRLEVTVQLPRESGSIRTIGSWAWIRSW